MEKPSYPFSETKNFNLLDMLSIVGIQLTKNGNFFGDYHIYVKELYEQAISNDVLIEIGDRQWIATIRMGLDRDNEISLKEVDSEKMNYYASQIKKSSFHEEIMKLPLKIDPNGDDIYKP
jgi:hypothetical protein